MARDTNTWSVVCRLHGEVAHDLSRADAKARAARHRDFYCGGHTRPSVRIRDRDVSLRLAAKLRLGMLANQERWIKTWKRLGKSLAVEMSRQDALVAWDAVEAYSTVFPAEKLDQLLDIAKVAYQLEHRHSRGTNLWVFAADRENRELAPAVVCRFCRKVLIDAAQFGVNYSTNPDVKPHVERCALGFLAGLPPVDILPDGTIQGCDPGSGSSS